MGHETTVHGCIQGSAFTREEYRKLQNSNIEVISKLPINDEYPFLSKSMFSIPDQKTDQGTYKSQVIHFGGSIKGLEFGDELIWIEKMENLLKKLYWFSAVAYIETEMDGEYKYSWLADKTIPDSYFSEKPRVTNLWKREIKHYDKIIESI